MFKKKDTKKAIVEGLNHLLDNAEKNGLDKRTGTLIGIKKYHDAFLVIVITGENDQRNATMYTLNKKAIDCMEPSDEILDIFYSPEEIISRDPKEKIVTQIEVDYNPQSNWIKRQSNKLKNLFNHHKINN